MTLMTVILSIDQRSDGTVRLPFQLTSNAVELVAQIEQAIRGNLTTRNRCIS